MQMRARTGDLFTLPVVSEEKKSDQTDEESGVWGDKGRRK